MGFCYLTILYRIDHTGLLRLCAAYYQLSFQQRIDLSATNHHLQNFHFLKTDQRIGLAVRDLLYKDFVSLMQFPEFPFQSDNVQIVKNGNTAFLAKTEFLIDDKLVPVAYKRVRRKNIWKMMKSFFQTNHALHCWNIGHELLESGIATPRPLAVMTPHRHQPNQPSYLAVEWTENAVDLETYCLQTDLIDANTAHQKLKTVAISLGKLLGKMHRENFSHRDLKPSNLLVKTCDKSVTTLVIDLDGAAQQSTISFKRRCRNLSRLALDMQKVRHFSSSNFLRFLKAYLATSSFSPTSWKVIWQEIAEMTALRSLNKQKKVA